MNKYIVLFFSIMPLTNTSAPAENYNSSCFVVVTNLDGRYAKLIVANADSFYNNVRQRFPLSTCTDRLKIYYSRTQSDTQKLLDEHGYKVQVEYGYAAPDAPEVYAHQFMNNGQFCGWDALFYQLSHKIVAANFSNCPAWFCEGLAGFMSKQRVIVNGNLTAPRPNPYGEQLLRDKIEEGARPNVKRLFSTVAEERFGNWDIGQHFARAFFCWLDETGNLSKYLANARTEGYGQSVLEKTVGKPCEKINMELIKFIKKNCYAGAYLKDGLDAQDPQEKEQAFLKAVELRPNYSAALTALAALHYKSKDYEKCRQYLTQILSGPIDADYRGAEEMTGDTYYYNEKNYSSALKYYKKAWEYSDYYEYRYRTAYKVANCCYKLDDPNNARTWYAAFLDCDWEPENTRSQVAYAQNFLGVSKMAATEGNKPEQKTSAASADLSKTGGKDSTRVRMQTSMGDIVVELDVNAAPVTVKNFLRYVGEGFFDGTIFHRVIPGFMIQGGGFTADMEQKKTHEPIKNEASNGLKNDRGTIAMARTNDPNSATAQFFINVKNNGFLNYGGPGKPGYAVFGKVVEGMDVVDKIAAVATTTKNGMGDVPVTPVVINSAKVAGK